MLLVIDKTVVFCYNYKENKKFKIKGVIKMLLEKIKQDMISALKSGDKEKKDTLSLLLSALNYLGLQSHNLCHQSSYIPDCYYLKSPH